MNHSSNQPAVPAISGPDGEPRVCIIIVTWNKKDYVLDLLQSVGELDYPATAIDMVVVDNASNDGTAEAVAAGFPGVHLICNSENLGGTGGFNTGLQWAFHQPAERYRYLWLLDNDVLVHRRALSDLVEILQSKEDVAVAGSTMMQLDYPWRLNEMGAFVERSNGALILNRHMEEILEWKGRPVQELLAGDGDLTGHLTHCRPTMDVDYVAAASLLVRAEVARKVGLWQDFFIHLDDVEWCLRIGEAGHRVVVSARSLIWHLSAAAKVPTWIIYYDNRNLLEMVRLHGPGPKSVEAVRRQVLNRAGYLALIGKTDMSIFLHWAVDDFLAGRFGKRELKMSAGYKSNHKALDVLLDSGVRRVLVPWTINLQATGFQEVLVRAKLARPELRIDYLTLPGGEPVYQVPNAPTVPVKGGCWTRRWQYFRFRGVYDLVLQSDYDPIIGLSWIGARLMFINDEGFTLLPGASLAQTLVAIKHRFFGARYRPRAIERVEAAE